MSEMSETSESATVVTPEFRGMYVYLFEPQTNDKGEKFYTIEALFKPGENLEALIKAAFAACAKRWGADQSKWPKNLRSPFRDQGDFNKEGYVSGAKLCRFKAKQDVRFPRPSVVDASLQTIIDPSAVYSGAYYRASVRAFTYPNPKAQDAHKQTPGVAFALNNVQKTRDGDPASGRTKAEDEFEPVAAAVADQGAGSIFG